MLHSPLAIGKRHRENALPISVFVDRTGACLHGIRQRLKGIHDQRCDQVVEPR